MLAFIVYMNQKISWQNSFPIQNGPHLESRHSKG